MGRRPRGERSAGQTKGRVPRDTQVQIGPDRYEIRATRAAPHVGDDQAGSRAGGECSTVEEFGMDKSIWHRWRSSIAHAFAIFGIGLAGASAGGEDYEDWLGIGC